MEEPLTKDNFKKVKLPALARQVRCSVPPEDEFVLIIDILEYLKGKIKRKYPLVIHIHNSPNLITNTYRTMRCVMHSDIDCFVLCDMSNPVNQEIYDKLISKLVMEKL